MVTKAFTITISNPTQGVTISDGEGIGTIRDIDDFPTIEIEDSIRVCECVGEVTVTAKLNQKTSFTQ